MRFDFLPSKLQHENPSVEPWTNVRPCSFHTRSGLRISSQAKIVCLRLPKTSDSFGGMRQSGPKKAAIVLRFVLQTELRGLGSMRSWMANRFILKRLAEREGFEPSVQVLARTTV
jgi:hypothetical protein